jgi:hypothetical protein
VCRYGREERGKGKGKGKAVTGDIILINSKVGNVEIRNNEFNGILGTPISLTGSLSGVSFILLLILLYWFLVETSIFKNVGAVYLNLKDSELALKSVIFVGFELYIYIYIYIYIINSLE